SRKPAMRRRKRLTRENIRNATRRPPKYERVPPAILTPKIDIVSLSGHELSESLCGPVLLHYAADRRFDVCLSRWAVGARDVWRDARRGQHDDAGRRLGSTCRRVAHCIWIPNAPRRIHLQRRDGCGLFHDSRQQRHHSYGEVFPDLERRTAIFQQRRTSYLLLLVFLVRRVLWSWSLEHRRVD